jgi:4-hydroxy-3-polyprenylbenzoate decarboxylase
VTLKEKRKLVLMVRETPLHKGHLRLMTMAADMGAHILPPIPSFYHHPKTIDDIIDQTVGKIFDYFGIAHNLFERWGEPVQSNERNGVHVSVAAPTNHKR